MVDDKVILVVEFLLKAHFYYLLTHSALNSWWVFSFFDIIKTQKHWEYFFPSRALKTKFFSKHWIFLNYLWRVYFQAYKNLYSPRSRKKWVKFEFRFRQKKIRLRYWYRYLYFRPIPLTDTEFRSLTNFRLPAWTSSLWKSHVM